MKRVNKHRDRPVTIVFADDSTNTSWHRQLENMRPEDMYMDIIDDGRTSGAAYQRYLNRANAKKPTQL